MLDIAKKGFKLNLLTENYETENPHFKLILIWIVNKRERDTG